MNLYKFQDYRGALSLFDKILAESPDDGLALDVYILAKTLFYYNIVQTNFLKGTYVETIFALPLAKMYAQKSSIPIDVTQILLITDYLRESLRVGHNGKLLEDLLELIKDKALQKVWTRKQEAHLLQNLLYIHQKTDLTRSEERRVGKECRSRWSPYH